MDRLLLFLCFLCIPWAARGQSAYEWTCWFDDEAIPRLSGSAVGDALSIDGLDGKLTEGFHVFHVQVADTAGRYSPPMSRLFYNAVDRSVKKLRYWFDEDLSNIFTINAQNGVNTIDVSHLQPGIHIIYCQIEDAIGNLTDVSSRLFFRQTATDHLQWAYWFDEDEETKQMTSQSGETVLIDVSELVDGFHTIHHQVRGLASSDVVTRMFIKIPQTENVADMTCICTVNEKMVGLQQVPASGGIISWNMDVSALPVGLHRAVFQVITATGAASTIAERFFVRAITPAEVGNMQCIYTLDNSDTQSQAGTMANGLFHFDIDVAELEDGLHRIAYLMVSEDGTATPQQTAFFWKTPVGGEGIVQYDYWLNDEEQAMKSFRLDKRENPFKLISLLPVDTQPIRSQCFHFEVRDGQPMLYAKNDFHIRFFDTDGRALSETRQYVDYQVGQEIKDITEIQESQTIAPLDNNHIKWYYFNALAGDSIAIKSNKACTIQVFSAEGQLLMNSDGFNSVVYRGAYLRQSGTFYIAVHDIKGDSSDEMILSYSHIDRYCVLSLTPNEIGNMSNSYYTMELFGNGYDKLKKAYISNGIEVIAAEATMNSSRSEAQVLFALPDKPIDIGNYDLELEFEYEGESEKLIIKNAVRVVTATPGSIEISMKQPSLTQSPYELTVNVRNSGNVGYTFLPMNIAFDNIANITNIEFTNFNVNLPADADSIGYRFMALSDNLLGKNVHGGMMFFFIPRIEAHEVKSYSFRITTSPMAQFNMYAWTGTPMELDTLFVHNVQKARRANQSHQTASNILSFGQHLEDGAGMVNDVFGGRGGRITQFLGQLTNIVCKTGVTLAAIQNATGNTVNQAWNEVARERGLDIEDDLVKYEPVATPYEILSGNPLSDEEFERLTNRQQQMANTPTPEPSCRQNIHTIRSVDPNDIIGYMAESGCNSIKDSLIDIYYTIEFENDPEIATAPAHNIYVTDTLDASKFDLSTFAPTRVKIGEKSAELTGDKNFVTTIDMRPEINAIAQVEGTFDEQKGIAKWHISSLDPMTMEPTDDVMQGVLPVNHGGNGMGEVMFDISLKPGMPHGTEINNRAGIVFDQNEVIMTPTWTNTIDRVKPTSRISDVNLSSDTTAVVSIKSSDEGSGPWRYNVYVQYGSGAWFLAAENVPADTTATVKIYDGIEHHFYCVATDMAGNVEEKEARSEFTLIVSEREHGDVNGDGAVDVADIAEIIDTMANGAYRVHADANGDGVVDVADIAEVISVMAAKARAAEMLHKEGN